MEDLVRRYSSRRDAQGNAHHLAEDIRMSSLEALLPDDLEKHVQLNRARFTSYGVLREEVKTYCECGGHANARNVRQKGPSHQVTTQWTLVHLAKARANKAKASTERAKAKASKDSTDSTDRTSTRARIRLNVGIVENVDITRKTVGARRTSKVVRRENTNPKSADAHNLDSKPSIVEPLQESEKMRGSEWIKIGVDTGAGKTAWPQSITYGTTIPGDSDLTFRTATGELVKGCKRVHVAGCDDWGSNLRVRGVQAPVCKPLLSVGEYTTKGGVTVLYGDKGYMAYRGCTVAYKENNVYNIYMKPRENKIDAMPLSGDSESGSCQPSPNL